MSGSPVREYEIKRLCVGYHMLSFDSGEAGRCILYKIHTVITSWKCFMSVPINSGAAGRISCRIEEGAPSCTLHYCISCIIHGMNEMHKYIYWLLLCPSLLFIMHTYKAQSTSCSEVDIMKVDFLVSIKNIRFFMLSCIFHGYAMKFCTNVSHFVVIF
jgi:hypothetical protein